MGHNEEHNRCIIIGGCASSTQATMDAAAVELERTGDHETLVLVSEIRQRAAEIERRYPCRGRRPE